MEYTTYYITPLLHPVVKHITISIMKLLSTLSTWDFKSLQIASYQLTSSVSSKLVLEKRVWLLEIFGDFGIGDESL